MKFKLVSDRMTPDIKKRNKQLDKLPKDSYSVFKDNTPKRSGNARNKTVLRGNTINANYSYAQPLDKGKSKQAPEGMTKPTVAFIKRQLDRILRN